MKRIVIFSMSVVMCLALASMSIAQVELNPDHIYRVTNFHTQKGRSLDVKKADKKSFMGETGNFVGQRWRFKAHANGKYMVIGAYERVLDVTNTEQAPFMSDFGNFTGQYWTITKSTTRPDYFHLVDAYGRYLNVSGTADKSVNVYSDARAPNIYDGMFWKFEMVGTQAKKAATTSHPILANGKVYLDSVNGTVGRGTTKGALQNVVQVNKSGTHYHLRNQDKLLTKVYYNKPSVIYFGSEIASSKANEVHATVGDHRPAKKPTAEGLVVGDQGFATTMATSFGISDGPHWTAYLQKLDVNKDQQLWIFEQINKSAAGTKPFLQTNDKFWIRRASRSEMYLRTKSDGVLGITNNASERTVFTVRAATK